MDRISQQLVMILRLKYGILLQVFTINNIFNILIKDPMEGYKCSCIHTLIGHEGNVQSVCFNPNGSTIASSSMDTTIRIWIVLTRVCSLVIRGNTSYVWVV